MNDEAPLTDLLSRILILIGLSIAFIGPYRLAIRKRRLTECIKNPECVLSSKPTQEISGLAVSPRLCFLTVPLFLILQSLIGGVAMGPRPYTFATISSGLPAALLCILAASPLLYLPHRLLAMATVVDMLGEIIDRRQGCSNPFPELPRNVRWLMFWAVLTVLTVGSYSRYFMEEAMWLWLAVFLTAAFMWFAGVTLSIRKALGQVLPEIMDSADQHLKESATPAINHA